jgi:hypothetical protein
MYKIIGADQKEYGPVTAEQLRQWLAEGRVSAQTQVKAEGATEWTALGTLPEFAAASAGTMPVMPGIAPASPAPSAAAAALVNGPAIGLIVVAVLGALLQIVSIIKNLVVGSAISGNVQLPAFVKMLSGPVGVVLGIIGILVSVVILLGAMKMKKLESYGLAMAASIIAMIPCFSPCCLLGLPIGIWAVVVLSKPEVKSAFH